MFNALTDFRDASIVFRSASIVFRSASIVFRDKIGQRCGQLVNALASNEFGLRLGQNSAEFFDLPVTFC